MNKKRILAFLLAAQMMLAALVSCGGNEPAKETSKPDNTPVETKAPSADGETDGTTDAETEAPAPAADPYADRLNVSDELPDMTFGGKDFRYLVDEKYAYQLYSEDDSGVGLDAVIYDRNMRVQDRFDIKISYMDSLGKESQDVLTQYAQVGEHIVEVCAYEQYMGNTPAIYFCWANWADIPYLNFDQPWWNKESIESHIINDYIFNIAGDLSLTAMQMTWCMAFNQGLMEDWGYPAEDLYNMVWNNEWTLDKLIEITSDKWEDVNGDGLSDNGDKFGFASPISHIVEETGEIGCATRSIPWITALGERAITVGEDRRSLNITIGTEKMYAATEKLVNFHNNTIGANKWATDDDYVNGNVGIYTAKFDIFFSRSEEIGFDVGVLPFPKYDTAQEKYLTTPDLFFTMFGVPVTLDPDDYAFVGIIMEALNAESWKTVYPAYYEEALRGRFSTDENMSKMIDLITNSRVYEYGILCIQSLAYPGKVPVMLCPHISDNNVDMASTLAQCEKSIRRSLAEILTFFDVEDETGILGADWEIPNNQFGS